MRLDKQVQEWFTRTPELVEAMFDGLPDVMFYVRDAAGRYLWADQTRIERARLKVRANIVGQTADPLFPVAGSSTAAQHLEVNRTARPIRDSLRRYRTCRGDRFWCLRSKFALLDASGHIVGLAGLSRRSATPERAPSKPQPTRAIPGLHRRRPGSAPHLGYTGFTVLPPFAAWMPGRVTADEREVCLGAFANRLRRLDPTEPLFFHPWSDCDETQRLKPGIAARSGVQWNPHSGQTFEAAAVDHSPRQAVPPRT